VVDVIIAGCGPTGAMLAAELRLHGVRVLVLEKEPRPAASFVRIVSLHVRSLEILAMRGLLDRFLERGRQRPVGGVFAAIPRPAPAGLESAYLLGIPQPVVVHLLEEHATERGAQVRRGCAVAGLEQDDEGVTVELAGGERLRSRYLVGCDGARSAVRKLLGVGFPGEPSRSETLMGELALAAPPEEIAAKVAEIRETHRAFSLQPFGEDVHRVVVPAAGAGAEPPTLEDFRRELRAIAGTDFGAHSPRWRIEIEGAADGGLRLPVPLPAERRLELRSNHHLTGELEARIWRGRRLWLRTSGLAGLEDGAVRARGT